MVDRIEFKELETEELPATSAVLLGAAHHLGTIINIINYKPVNVIIIIKKVKISF